MSRILWPSMSGHVMSCCILLWPALPRDKTCHVMSLILWPALPRDMTCDVMSCLLWPALPCDMTRHDMSHILWPALPRDMTCHVMSRILWPALPRDMSCHVAFFCDLPYLVTTLGRWQRKNMTTVEIRIMARLQSRDCWRARWARSLSATIGPGGDVWRDTFLFRIKSP